ncbi:MULTISPECIES: tRNA (adenosine(37)-N6)-threonylcarbamoyltransferase complex ATPase subunit type 1 TsaE [Holospora]|uniref:tRNA threonylcarbamoyladenosine biosynthesis protein TsaE n=2 Tax=Holospora TaxID=44747 RepID=A0A061JHD8_9PROT|nr:MULTISPECIES: tRNA (adenosine(37)-N6)-threonylcarbamoyltransferase complex ATPase subunit type 1 TsaE [Holospora]ETZ04688.1 tRNA threonylcarbamoyladenosine biosynthesis protein TsaE [Holospora undulata HU1]GAJ46232.1 tRNA threonylcarbamoyladenosine biosynthesis protein TsaE [Holospora elegans E1]
MLLLYLETFLPSKQILLNEVVNEQELKQHAAQYVSLLQNGIPVLLYGEIGVGKTTWVRSLLQTALGKDLRVSSPTFSLMIPYTWNDQTIWHIDLYRLEKNPDRLKSLGIEDYLHHNICLIEWADYLGYLYPETYVRFELQYTSAHQNRILKISWCT